MTSIFLINKTGTLYEEKVTESIDDIWFDMNFKYTEDEINKARPFFNREFLYLTRENGEKVIITKKFIYVIK
jgi:hypothetical protein